MAKQLHLTSAGVWFKLDGFPGDYRIFCSQLLNRAWFRRCLSSCVQLQHSEEAFGDFCGFITSHFLPCKRCSAPGADIPLPGSFLGRALFVSHDCRLSAEGAQAPSAVAGSREANIRTSALRVVPASPQPALSGREMRAWTAEPAGSRAGAAEWLLSSSAGFYTHSLSQTQQKGGTDYTVKELFVFRSSLSRQVL